MPHLLYIESSPRKTRSASIEVSQAFLTAWQASHPGSTVDVLDVWNTPLPEFDGAALDAKYAGLAGEPLSPAQAMVAESPLPAAIGLEGRWSPPCAERSGARLPLGLLSFEFL